jgi:phosphoglucosamine mutase
MIEKNKKASELLNIFSLLPQSIESLDYNITKFKYKEKDQFIITKINSAKNLLGKNSRIILRASGTENKLRIMGECTNKTLLNKTLKQLKTEIKTYING